MSDVRNLLRENVRDLRPYVSARHEFAGDEAILLDANESPYGEGLNRYPDPLQRELRRAIAEYRGVVPDRVIVGNGSDEIIDLLMRAFCIPGVDRVATFAPSYGMYRVAAAINDVDVITLPLDPDFQPAFTGEEAPWSDPHLKLVVICSPNNPTGNAIRREAIEQVLRLARGIVVVDEAYVDFAPETSVLPLLDRYPHLTIVQTFSKAWGLAGIRLGVGFASAPVVDALDRIRLPYNVGTTTQRGALEALERADLMQARARDIVAERERLRELLIETDCVVRVYPSDANFLLVRFRDAGRVYDRLRERGIVVRNVNGLVEGCLRISVGTPEENERLVAELKEVAP